MRYLQPAYTRHSPEENSRGVKKAPQDEDEPEAGSRNPAKTTKRGFEKLAAARFANGGPTLVHAQREPAGCSPRPFEAFPSGKTKGRLPLAKPNAPRGSPRRFSVRQP